MGKSEAAIHELIEEFITPRVAGVLHGQLVAPKWTHLRWHKALQGITLSRVLIPKGNPLFQNDEWKVFRQRKWRTHAYLVDGSLDLGNFQDDGIPSIWEIPYFEIDATNPDGSGGVRHYSTKHPVSR